MRALFLAAAVAITATAAVTVVATAAQSVRDAPRPNPIGTASLTGRVVTADPQPRPIGGAIVTITASELGHDISVITDDEGRFAFTKLPAGRFSIAASKVAFLTGAAGAKRPGRPGTPVSIAAGQTMTNVTVVLTHGAALSGTVRDASGEPGFQTYVTVLKADGTTATPAVLADDRGRYRVFGLPPGDYCVAAAVRPGNPGDISIRSSADVDAIFAALQAGAGRQAGVGQTAGPAAGLPSSTSSGSTDRASTYAPVFYPGTAVFSQAARVTLGAGDDLDGIDLSLSLTPVVTAAGTITGPSGRVPADVQMDFRSNSPAVSVVMAAPNSPNQRLELDGTFRRSGLAPGDYTITARTPAGAGPMLWASANITVNGRDVEGIALVLRPGLTFGGRLRFDASSLAPPRDLSQLQVRLASTTAPADSSAPSGPQRAVAMSASRPSVPPGSVAADGAFQIKDVLPATYQVTCTPPAGGWWLRSVMARGHDLLDLPIDLGTGDDVVDAVVTFSDRHSALSGTLQSQAGLPATDFFVVVLPVEHEFWRPGARRIQSARPASDGHFTFKDLPAGDYILAAVTDMEPGDLGDTGFLASLVPAGVKVTIADGQRVTQDLRIAR